MLKLTVMGVIMAGGIGYGFIHWLQIPSVSAAGSSIRRWAVVERVGEAEASLSSLAKAFSDQVVECRRLAIAASSPDDSEVARCRNALRSRFDVAYQAIEKIEQRGDLSQTAAAREQMQEAIGVYMMSGATTKDDAIARDLDAYSRFMTQVLIARSIKEVK